jgi:hypothetical protein
MAWGPNIPQVSFGDNTWFLHIVLSGFAHAVPGWVVQKLLLLSVFFLAGLGAHRLTELSPVVGKYPRAAYVAGMLYVFNPFVYTRLMAGQWMVLLGYALLPWALVALWRLMLKPGWSDAWRAMAWTAAVGLVSIHAVGFVMLAALVMFTVHGREQIKDRIKWSALTFGGWIVIHAIWLVPALLGESHLAEQVGGFGSSQLQAFATSGTVAGNTALSALLLTGFWADKYGRFTLPSHLPTWWPAVVLLGILVVFGIVQIVRKRDKLGISLLILGAIAWWLGMGVGSRLSAGTAEFLTAHVPFYAGYREPQKWLMLLALLYAYAAATGVVWIVGKVPKPAEKDDADWRPVVTGSAALLPLLLVPILLWGAGGQLRSAQYPADWYAVRQKLDHSAGDSPVLILPWRLYMQLDFAGRVVANPAGHFFPQHVETGNDAELKGVPVVNTTPVQKTMNQQIIPHTRDIKNAGTLLRQDGVRYIVLYKEADWQLYDWVDRQPDVRKVYDGPNIRLYETAADGGEN